MSKVAWEYLANESIDLEKAKMLFLSYSGKTQKMKVAGLNLKKC